MGPPRSAPWAVLMQEEPQRVGGDLRRARIFRVLAQRTGAETQQGWNRPAISQAVRRAGGSRLPWRPRVRLATCEFLTPGAVVLARRIARPVALDVHDHPVVQAAALGRRLDPDFRATQIVRIEGNLGLFPIQIAPSASFADLVGLAADRVIVAPNGADTERVRPAPFPERPEVGMVSGASPGRGIETLVDACRGLRSVVPDLRLHLWLASNDEVGRAYIADLTRLYAAEPWLNIGSAPYATLGGALAQATVLVIPHPANAYFDVAVPVKLFDAMAAGRPVVVTPRTETRRIVEASHAGRIAAGDAAADLAAAILPILEDRALAARLGRNGRAAAEREYDWRIISDRVADAVLQRIGEGAR